MNATLQVEVHGALTTVLDDMQQAVAELASVLEAESHAIRGADVEALDQAGARKQGLMQQLEKLDAERVPLAQGCAADPARDAQWQQVLDSLRHCRELNQRNGSVVGQRLGHVRQALSILTGRSSDASVYGRSGALYSKPRSQTLAEA